jgi:hypothetical protein
MIASPYCLNGKLGHVLVQTDLHDCKQLSQDLSCHLVIMTASSDIMAVVQHDRPSDVIMTKTQMALGFESKGMAKV